MAKDPSLNIAVIPGDGIGIEVTNAALEVMREAERAVGGFRCNYQTLPAGAFCYRDTGESLPKETVDRSDQADAIFLGACGWPEIRYPDGTEIRPQVELRFIFDLYAGVRPIRFFPGLPKVLANLQDKPIDLIIIRESTEGLFASRGTGKNREVATETLVITRRTTERLMRFGFNLARQRKAQGHPGQLLCVDKANIFSSMAFMRAIYEEVGAGFPDVEKGAMYVDAAALNLVRQPWAFDVMVMENMYGDILSDLGAGLIGGMGMAPSGDIGDDHAVFQPSHGTAPDIAGKGIANPIAMILSGAMMYRWLADRKQMAILNQAAERIEQAVARFLETGDRLPYDQGGRAKTGEIVEGILRALAAGAGGTKRAVG
jgi:3-isopropylmalate dehydrogenase